MLLGNIHVSLVWKTDQGSRFWLGNFRQDGKPGWLWGGITGCRCIIKERTAYGSLLKNGWWCSGKGFVYTTRLCHCKDNSSGRCGGGGEQEIEEAVWSEWRLLPLLAFLGLIWESAVFVFIEDGGCCIYLWVGGCWYDEWMKKQKYT